MPKRGHFDPGVYTEWYVTVVVRWPLLTIVLMSALAVFCGRYALDNLKMDTDTSHLISSKLDWRKDLAQFNEAFPQLRGNLVMLIEGSDGPSVREAARRAYATLAQDHQFFKSVYTEAADPFIQKNAFLFLPLHILELRVDALLRAQPALARLHRDPTLAGLASLLEEALDATRLNPVSASRGRRDPVADEAVLAFGNQPLSEPMIDEFDSLARAMAIVLESDSVRMDWSALGSFDVRPQTSQSNALIAARPASYTHHTMLILKPVLDSAGLLPAGRAIERLRSVRDSMQIQNPDLRIRITGDLVMQHDETKTVVKDAQDGVFWVLGIVLLVLVIGLRSVSLVCASILTLLVGLACTAAFAAFAVGRVNLVSVVFAVLYVGLAIDYAIHYALWFRDLRASGSDTLSALTAAGRDVGISLTLCALTTGIGFLVFVPTSYIGVSELGLIAGVGMFIGLAVTLTLLPALLRVLSSRHEVRRFSNFNLGAKLVRVPVRRPQLVLTLTCVAAAAASLAISRAQFDDDPLNLRDSNSEAVRTYRQLIAQDDNALLRLSVLATTHAQVASIANRLKVLPPVAEVLTPDSLVPIRQTDKLELIDSLAVSYSSILNTSRQKSDSEQAAKKLLSLAERIRAEQLPRPGYSLLSAAIRHRVSAQGPVDPSTHARMTGNLELVLGEIGQAMNASAFTLESMPTRLRANWVNPSAYRIDIVPRENLSDRKTLLAYIDSVRSIVPQATGLAVVQLETGKVVLRSFQQALLLAMLAVVATLYLMRRNWRHVAIVCIPLLLSFIFAVAGLVTLDQSFNFANIVALPLILGVGVDNGIHMLNRHLHAPAASGNPLETSTARGVLVSALTTAASFGYLSMSNHPGTASMGVLLLLAMILTLLCTLIVLPALLCLPSTETDA